MRSYIKVYGPPLLKAVKTLEKLAIDVPDVCIMDTLIEATTPAPTVRPPSRTAKRKPSSIAIGAINLI